MNDKKILMSACYRLAVFVTLFTTTQALWACMPHSDNDVFIARLQSSQPIQIDPQQKGFDLQFSNPRFVFRTLRMWFFYSKPEHWQSYFELTGIEPNDLVIGLAYPTGGSKSTEYALASLATLSCKDDKLILGKPLVPFLAWNRENGSCRHDSHDGIGILDGFIGEDQSYYLQKLQTKYPTCKKLNAAFPSNADGSVSEQDSHPQISFWGNIRLLFGHFL